MKHESNFLEAGIPPMLTSKTNLQQFLADADIGRKLIPLAARQTIFTQGDEANAIFLITRGKIKIIVTSSEGKEAVIAVLDTGDFFGQGCLVGQTRCVATAQAMTDAEVMRFEKSAIARVIHEDPAFDEIFVRYLLNRVIRVEEDLVDQMFNTSEKRLARALLLLANLGGEEKPVQSIVKVSQETLAEMIGTTRPRVNYFMNKFRKLGFISYNGSGKLEINTSLLRLVLSDANLHPGAAGEEK